MSVVKHHSDHNRLLFRYKASRAATMLRYLLTFISVVLIVIVILSADFSTVPGRKAVVWLCAPVTSLTVISLYLFRNRGEQVSIAKWGRR